MLVFAEVGGGLDENDIEEEEELEEWEVVEEDEVDACVLEDEEEDWTVIPSENQVPSKCAATQLALEFTLPTHSTSLPIYSQPPLQSAGYIM